MTRIEVQGAVRSWQIWHRYSEFVALHDELTRNTSAAPPAAIPPKHSFSLLRTLKDDKIIEERRVGLESYLRAIISSKDSQWRDAFVFKDFLGVPVGKLNGDGSSNQFTSSSWLDEQADLQTLVRDIRADINKRDALAVQGDVSASHTSNVQAKKKLAALLTRITTLTKGLQTLSIGGMSEGEIQRRSEMIARLQDDCEKLGKMVIAARQAGSSRAFQSASSSAGDRDPAAQADRNALFSGPGGSITRPVTRVFGQPQETEQTRPLDNTGLVQLQNVQMEQQDSQLSQLSSILQRQKHLGLAISSEIEQQNEMLDQLATDVDKTAGKLGSTKKQLNRLG